MSKPHIAKHNGRWAIWVQRGRGCPNIVPSNTFRDAAVGARWLRGQTQHTSTQLWPFKG